MWAFNKYPISVFLAEDLSLLCGGCFFFFGARLKVTLAKRRGSVREIERINGRCL